MPPSQSYKRGRVACQHSPDDQTLWLQAGEDDFIHVPSGPDCVACERKEEEDPSLGLTMLVYECLKYRDHSLFSQKASESE